MFCIWDGGRLPSEAEWNAAAEGGNKQRAYPWSDPPESLQFDGHASAGAGDRPTFAVGSFPSGAGLWGTLDLAGNVYEWVRDSGDYPPVFPVAYVAGPMNPLDLRGDTDVQQARVLRGGSFKSFVCPTCSAQARLRSAARETQPAGSAYNDTGVRCVR